MPEQIPRCMSMELMLKWRALAERRRAHLVELYDSGRWKHYYTQAQMVARMREAIQLVEAWNRLCAAHDEHMALKLRLADFRAKLLSPQPAAPAMSVAAL